MTAGTTTAAPGDSLERGTFVRVKPDSEFRAGQDGMVMAADDGETVGLMFGYDRHNQSQIGATTGLTEAWQLDELDLTSVCR